MLSQIRPAIVALLMLTLVTGVLYPLAVTGIAVVAFPHQAGGSIIVAANGKAVGSSLIGQFFDDPCYFWPRPSATVPVAYTAFNGENGTSSTGSNQGPTNPALVQAVKKRADALRKADPTNPKPIPVDLVTASASGLDPHISPAAADYQVARVARARGMSEDNLRQLVTSHTEGRQLEALGEPRVNVLELNLALDRARTPATNPAEKP
jgi:K+-transporting ATPase ATPase C chain